MSNAGASTLTLFTHVLYTCYPKDAALIFVSYDALLTHLYRNWVIHLMLYHYVNCAAEPLVVQSQTLNYPWGHLQAICLVSSQNNTILYASRP